MLAAGLCAAFSGLTGFGLSLALAGAGVPGSGAGLFALGLAGFAGVVSLPFRRA